jgi:hypothetical protein
MTYPQKRKIQRERIVSLGLTLLMLAMLWFLAATLQMTGAHEQQRLFQTLTLEHIVLPEVMAKTERPSPIHVSAPPKAIPTTERLEALMKRMMPERTLQEATPLERRPVSTHQELQGVRVDAPIRPDDLSERLRLTDPFKSPVGNGQRLPGRGTRASGAEQGGIARAGQAPDGSVFEEQRSRKALATEDFARPQAREVPPELPSIERQEQIDVAEEILDPDELIQWMRLRPGELPPGIKRHVDWQRTDLTSTAALKHEGETYELYLMARLPIREIHLVLVKGHQTYYLIDRSFQHEGRKFRIGRARRNQVDGETSITGVISEERAAASPEAARFYSVFLSWWQRERLRL